MTLAAIEAALLVMNRDQMEAPLPEHEVRAIARSISRYPATAGMESPPLIGLGLEEFLAESTAGVQWMLDRVIVDGALVAIVGRPESFKTMGMLDLGLVGAGAADAWLDIGRGSARPLIYISNEKAGATPVNAVGGLILPAGGRWAVPCGRGAPPYHWIVAFDPEGRWTLTPHRPSVETSLPIRSSIDDTSLLPDHRGVRVARAREIRDLVARAAQ